MERFGDDEMNRRAELAEQGNREQEALQTELERLARRSMRKRRLTVACLALVFALAMLTGIWLVGRRQGENAGEAERAEIQAQLDELDRKYQELVNNPVVVSPVSPQIDLDVVYSEIKSIGELASVEYLFSDAAKFTDSRYIGGYKLPWTEKSFILKWDGVIKAGIELDQVRISVDRSDEENKMILVYLPKVDILSYEIDDDSVEVVDEKDNIFNNITIEDKVAFDAKTKEAMKTRAIENGLLEKARENAEDILTRLLLGIPAIGEEYTIAFIAPEDA